MNTPPPIPLTDVAWQHAQVRGEIQAGFDQLLDDPTCDGAHLVAALEGDFRAYLGAGWHAVGAQSGTAAEFLLLKALGIGPGDEVITVPNSDLATTAAIRHAGARFTFLDLAPGSFNIDPERVEAAITGRTRAILAVHMHGLSAPMERLRAIAARHDLLLLEDATLALGARSAGRLAGTLGDGAFVSFAPRKVLGGIGNGGMVLTRSAEVAERVRLLRGYGLDPSEQDLPIAERQLLPGQRHVAEGHNLKLDGVQALVVRAKFARVEAWGALRAEAAARYDALLAGCPGVVTPSVPPGDAPAWRNYTILCERREDLRAHLTADGITTGLLYTPPVHLQPVYAGLGLGPGSFPEAESRAPRLLNLPIYPGITEEQLARVAEGIRAFTERAWASVS